METATVSYEVELRDYRALMAYLCKPVVAKSRQLGRVLGVATAALAGLLGVLFVESVLSFLLGMLVLAVLLFVSMRIVTPRAQREIEPIAGGFILCKHDMRLTAEGLETETPYQRRLTLWRGVIGVSESDDHVFLRVDRGAAYIVPKRAFTTREALTAFLDVARARAHEA